MTDQRPDAGDNTLSTDNEATPPEAEEVEPTSEQPVEDEVSADTDAEPTVDEAELDPADDLITRLARLGQCFLGIGQELLGGSQLLQVTAIDDGCPNAQCHSLGIIWNLRLLLERVG